MKDIELDGYHAEVTIELRNDTKLPDNAIAEIRQTSLLGEKFVSLSRRPRPAPATSPLGDGDVIPLDRTGRNPEVEEVLGALSLILNGGGVAQLKTIAQELNKAVTGREDDVRSVLSQIDTFTGSLDTNKAQIVDAIEALNRLALSAHQQEGNIDEALEELPSALTSIDGQRQDLVRMLQALDQLVRRRRPGDQGVQGRDHRLAAPAPAGAQPAGRVRRRLRQRVQRVPDLPVRRRGRRPRPAGGPQPAHGRLHQPVDHPRRRPDPGAADRTRPTCCRPSSTRASWSRTCSTASPAATSPAPPARRCSTRPRRCSSSRSSARSRPTGTRPCASLLNTVPGLPGLAPGVPPPAARRRRPPGGGVLGGLGLGRSGTGPWNDAAHGGPTMAQLQAVYDPSLVNLLVPQLVRREEGGR